MVISNIEKNYAMKTVSLNTNLVKDSACVHVHVYVCVCVCVRQDGACRGEGVGGKRELGIGGRSTTQVHVYKCNFGGKNWDGIVLTFGKT